jgi:glycerol-3-phosphate acyltransferase PlsY
MDKIFAITILAIISYLLGSIPTAIIAGKVLKNIDIRQYGSGNAGATNVFRVLGWRAGLIVLFIDILKGFLAAWLLVRLFPQLWSDTDFRIYWQITAGIIAILGHIWTIFAGFRGGKGVGTAAGVVLGLQPVPVLICLLVFIFVVVKTRYVSLGSIISAILLPVILLTDNFLLHLDIPMAMIVLSILLALLIIFTHRQNIKRLIQGSENKITFTKKESPV